ncbi:hypothetical protein [Sphingomonas sp. VNH70]|uniref:hypothetical protein n=1 Tax=Sphingomonas silueang TaxID=3156617 RepID=UPI0032B425EE
MRARLERAMQAFALPEHQLPTGKVLLDLIRQGSSYRAKRIPTLYVTHRFLHEQTDLDAAALDLLVPDERGSCFEHVVPLQFTLDADAFRLDPQAAIAPPLEPEWADLPWLNRVARALLTPVCLVGAHEDARLDRKTHPDPVYPFARYYGPALRMAQEAPMIVYDSFTGERIEVLAAFTWQDHFDRMAASPLFRGLQPVVEAYFDGFASREPTLAAAIAARPGGAVWPVPPLGGDRPGWYTEAEQAGLRALIRELVGNGPVAGPATAIELPVNASRVTVTVRHPTDHGRILLRINIGPDHGKRELYFCAGKMHPDGMGWLAGIADRVNAQDGPCRLLPRLADGKPFTGFRIDYHDGRAGQPVDRISGALRQILPVLSASYPVEMVAA